MPNRLIKESICTSDTIDALSWFEEVLFYRLIVSCDDFGRYDGRPSIIKNRLFPLKDEQLTLAEVANGLVHLGEVGLIAMYEHDGKPFLCIPTWDAHQTIRAKRSKYPAPDGDLKSTASICKHMLADCKQVQANALVIQSNPIQSESNPNPIQSNARVGKNKFSPPTREEVAEYCKEKGIIIDVDYFYDHYSGNGWKAGRVPMSDWKATVRNWYRRDQKNGGAKIKTPYDNLRTETNGDDADHLARMLGVHDG